MPIVGNQAVLLSLERFWSDAPASASIGDSVGGNAKRISNWPSTVSPAGPSSLVRVIIARICTISHAILFKFVRCIASLNPESCKFIHLCNYAYRFVSCTRARAVAESSPSPKILRLVARASIFYCLLMWILSNLRPLPAAFLQTRYSHSYAADLVIAQFSQSRRDLETEATGDIFHLRSPVKDIPLCLSGYLVLAKRVLPTKAYWICCWHDLSRRKVSLVFLSLFLPPSLSHSLSLSLCRLEISVGWANVAEKLLKILHERLPLVKNKFQHGDVKEKHWLIVPLCKLSRSRI